MNRFRVWMLCILTAALLAFAAAASAEEATIVASGTCGNDNGSLSDNMTWTLDSDGLLTISGEGEMYYYDMNALWGFYRSQIKSVKIEEGVTSIGKYAFYSCANLTQIELPSGITGIEEGLFYQCANLKSIEIPSGVTSIGGSAFKGCTSLTQIDLPESVTNIGGSAFEGCTSLTQIDLPEGVTSIGNSAFEGCTSLTQIELPEGVTSIGGGAFHGCTSLTQIELPEGVTSIGGSAFHGCTSLTQIELPESVTSIDGSAFSGCTSLTQIDLPEGVTSIGSSAFYGCTSLTQIELPEGVTSIGSSAFYGCTSLTQIELPEGVTSIGNSAFSGCTSLTQIDLPEGVTSIGDWTFSGCTSLTQIDLPEGVTSIGGRAFDSCTSLTQIELPESVTSIGNRAFEYCYNLKYVIIYAKDGLTNISATFPKTDVTVYCWEYYYAESWARENGYTVKLLDDMLDAGGNINWSAAEKSVYLETTLKLRFGDVEQLTYSVFPFEAVGQWTSSNPEIVRVDENGVVTALQNGEADITLTLGDVSATCHVTVYTPVTSFELSRSEMYVVAKKTGRLSVVSAQPENHNDSFAWSSSNETYATVDQEGTVTGKVIGDATITVTTQNGVTRECLVHVCYPVTAVKFADETVNIHTGGTKQLTANVTMRTMSCVNQLVTFVSSDPTVATVDEYGVVTAVGAGTATITAATEDGGISAACEIAVTDEHEIVTDAEIPATRKQTGLTEGAHCAVCGEVLKAQQVIAARTDLAVAELPAETKTVLAEAFAGSDVECVVLSSACETIGSRAFADCAQLALIEIPEGVTSIADDAFEGSASVALVVKDGSYAQSYAERLGLKWRAE